ncbi:phosphatidylglycerophosphatase A [Aquabacterium sp. J223]|uniref:phosphatidylglycerophosphatase A family protein n=1 Tax=Aquabacterium sp. J223 TaxID=2898431 RepID=UPI00391737AC
MNSPFPAAPRVERRAAPEPARDPLGGSADAPGGRGADIHPRRATAALMRRHPAHWIALGFGAGLSPKAPGTVGTLWAWLVFIVVDRVPVVGPGDGGWAVIVALAFGIGWWACTRTAQSLRTADPGAVVWDEVVAFWLVLWLVTPTSVLGQCIAFGLFRFFDAVKPPPVGWADRLFKPRRAGDRIGPAAGFGILFDDLVAAGCTLLVVALGRQVGALLW